MKGPTRLRIDRIACDGRGLCAELLPELITLDDWGYPIIAKGAVPQRLEELARDTVDVCPKLALTLVQNTTSKSQSGYGRKDGATESLRSSRPSIWNNKTEISCHIRE
jgi:ferredoxin